MTHPDTHARKVLFLQGPPSPFWYELAAKFEGAGAQTLRVNLSTADWAFWRRSGAMNYRGTFEDWPRYLRELIAAQAITDIVYFSDRFPYHVAARDAAEACGIAAHAIEFGYLRPGWLTLERGGMGRWSHFPDDPETIREVARACRVSPGDGFAAHKTSTELTFEILFNLINQYYGWIYPGFRKDRVHNATYEYISGLVYLIKKRARAAELEKKLRDYSSPKSDYTIVPLQLQTDYQIRENTTYKDQRLFIRAVLNSFARHAPRERHLLFKTHPLDPGILDWRRLVLEIAAELGIADRIFCFDGGDLGALIAHSKGVVVSNSTVGLIAIRAHCPTIALGAAVYDMPGLTHQSGLDTFWTAPDVVDPALCDAFVSALAGTIQVRGSVYDPEGRALACAAIVERILENKVNGYGACIDPPPRLAKHA